MMQTYSMEYDRKSANEAFDEMPEIGDTVDDCSFDEAIIVGIDIVNKRKMVLKVVIKGEVTRRNDQMDYSTKWEKLPDRFLESTVDELPDSSFKNY